MVSSAVGDGVGGWCHSDAVGRCDAGAHGNVAFSQHWLSERGSQSFLNGVQRPTEVKGAPAEGGTAKTDRWTGG